jgi:hypothetical protein
MRQDSPHMNKNFQLRLVKSPIAQANHKSVININKIHNKNYKLKENQISKFKEDDYERLGL